MSSALLISHHLFVAAAKEKGCFSPESPHQETVRCADETPVHEIPFELVEFGRPLPFETVSSKDALSLRGSG
jgi:hypothetical protein